MGIEIVARGVKGKMVDYMILHEHGNISKPLAIISKSQAEELIQKLQEELDWLGSE